MAAAATIVFFFTVCSCSGRAWRWPYRGHGVPATFLRDSVQRIRDGPWLRALQTRPEHAARRPVVRGALDAQQDFHRRGRALPLSLQASIHADELSRRTPELAR